MAAGISSAEAARRRVVFAEMSARGATWAQMAAEFHISYRSFQDWAWRNVEGAQGYRSSRPDDTETKRGLIQEAVGKGWRLWRIARRVNMSVPYFLDWCERHNVELPPHRDARKTTGDERKAIIEAARRERMDSIRKVSEIEARETVKPTMQRNCLRCEGNFLSERADGAWLRMCPNCRSVSHVGAGMEGAAGRQVRGRAA